MRITTRTTQYFANELEITGTTAAGSRLTANIQQADDETYLVTISYCTGKQRKVAGKTQQEVEDFLNILTIDEEPV